jgi:tripartite-type tricarboxylate transporter receptor subunit TctC
MRRLFITAIVISAFAGMVQSAHSQNFPSREIRLICGFPAGSGADIFYRFIAERLRTVIGKPVIVENRPGNQGFLAATEVAKSKPDGHTIGLEGGNGFAAAKFLYKTPSIDPLKDFEFVGAVLTQGWYLSVDGNSPIKSLAELTAHLKVRGDKGAYATSTTIGTVFAELYKDAAGVTPTQVNYKSVRDSVNDLASGQIDMAMTDPAFTIGSISSGKLRALAVSTAQRMAATPDVPAMAELGYKNIDLSVWWTAQVAAGTPAPIVEQLGRWFEAVLKMEETQKFFASVGSEPLIMSPQQTRARLIENTGRWEQYIKQAKIEPM